MSRRGLYLVLMVAACLLTLSAWNWYQAFQKKQWRTCVSQLHEIEGAKEQFAIEHDGRGPLSFDELVPAYLRARPVCPGGGEYALGDMQQHVACTLEKHRLDDVIE
ncbi:MAG TPA: hypothetical protein PJ991_04830 [Kiritimatiellia bacterium]|nr:hypothetical protein [Kiritimatiellia bacterium]